MSADLAGVDDPPRPVEPPGGVEAAQQLTVQALPHPSGLPVPEPPPSGHARAADLLGHHAPRHTGDQHEHDRRERRPIADPRTPGPLRRTLRQQPLEHLPEPVVDQQRVAHLAPPDDRRYVIQAENSPNTTTLLLKPLLTRSS